MRAPAVSICRNIVKTWPLAPVIETRTVAAQSNFSRDTHLTLVHFLSSSGNSRRRRNCRLLRWCLNVAFFCLMSSRWVIVTSCFFSFDLLKLNYFLARCKLATCFLFPFFNYFVWWFEICHVSRLPDKQRDVSSQACTTGEDAPSIAGAVTKATKVLTANLLPDVSAATPTNRFLLQIISLTF